MYFYMLTLTSRFGATLETLLPCWMGNVQPSTSVYSHTQWAQDFSMKNEVTVKISVITNRSVNTGTLFY